MELSTQIKQLRKAQGWNQEQLAEKAYVSRQTVSNWENEKSYPDVHSLLILAELFGVSLDELIKGDVEVMKKEIKQESIREYDRWANIFSVMFIAALVSAYPLLVLLRVTGAVIWAILMAATIAVAFKVEKLKKENDIQTYKEIVAFTEGRTLDEIEQIREKAKRPYQKVLLALGSAAVALIVMMIMHLIFNR